MKKTKYIKVIVGAVKCTAYFTVYDGTEMLVIYDNSTGEVMYSSDTVGYSRAKYKEIANCLLKYRELGITKIEWVDNTHYTITVGG